jgi:hypothetical protein
VVVVSVRDLGGIAVSEGRPWGIPLRFVNALGLGKSGADRARCPEAIDFVELEDFHMKLHLRSWSVAAGALLSVALVGCDAATEEPKLEPAPANPGPGPGRPANYPGPRPKEIKPTDTPDTKPADTPAPTPDTKPAEPAVEAPKEATKPADATPAPKDESKKEETPK